MTKKRKRADPLRQENYGLPIGQMIKKMAKKYNSPKRTYLGVSTCTEFNCKYEFVESHGEDVSPNLKLRRGDIAYVRPTSAAPKFMFNKYVVVLDRYRVTKYKYNDFHDYGVVLMVITGPDKGRVGRAYGCLGSITNTMINNSEEI